MGTANRTPYQTTKQHPTYLTPNVRFLRKNLEVIEIFCNFASVQWNEELQSEFLILLF